MSLTLNRNEIGRWFRDNGDNTHNLTYNLNEESVVMDLGGYTGVWAQQIINKYNPRMYIIEPIPKFYDGMVTKFSGNNKVNLLNVGISTEDREGVIYMNGDSTSSNLSTGEGIKVTFNTMKTILGKWKLESIDLIQINIEGDEYPLLESMLYTGIINKFKNIQVQFHMGIDGDIERRNKIREGLKTNGFKNKFDYPFVWESWEKL
tara:strand:- start:6015 stop:6629 length:615 start_codon:yes stop_codon:yes gene_type:complete